MQFFLPVYAFLTCLRTFKFAEMTFKYYEARYYDISQTIISPTGHFADRHFAKSVLLTIRDRHFADTHERMLNNIKYLLDTFKLDTIQINP